MFKWFFVITAMINIILSGGTVTRHQLGNIFRKTSCIEFIRISTYNKWLT